jgi:hypothetical protein
MNQLSSSDDELLNAAVTALCPIVRSTASSPKTRGRSGSAPSFGGSGSGSSSNVGIKLLTVDDTERLANCLVACSQGILATDKVKAERSKDTLRAILSILGVLTNERPHQEAVYVNGGVQILMQVALLDQTVPTIAPIFEILTNVAKIPETIVAILHHNGLTILLDLLNSIIPEMNKAGNKAQKVSAEVHRQRKNLTKQLLSLLLKLVHHSDDNFEDRERVIAVVTREDTLVNLSSLLPTERVGKVQKVVVELLLLAIISDESRTAAAKASILFNLVQLISISMAHSNGKHDKSSDHSSQRLPKIVELLTALVRGHVQNATELSECGVLALLLDLLAPQSTSSLTVEISRLLAVLSPFPMSHGFITSAISQVTQLVSSAAPEIVENGLTILANLTAVPESRSIVFNDHTVNTVMPLMSSPKPGIQLQAAKLLSGLSQDPRASSEMFSSVLKPLVVQLTSQLTPVRHAAVTTLLDLLRSSQPSGGVDSSAGVKAMLAKADGAISAIVNISSSCKATPVSSGSTQQTPEVELKRACAEILSLLSGNPDGRTVLVATPQAIQLILQSLFSSDEVLVMWSVISIASILRIQDNNIAEALKACGGLLVLSRLLDSPSTSQILHHATISAVALLFSYPSCRSVLIEEGIIRRLLNTILDATKKLQEGLKLEASARTRLFTAIAALQQLVQTATEVAQSISKDATSLKSLADSIVILTPKLGSNAGQADSDLCEQVVYLALLLCSAHPDTWSTLVRAGGLNLLLALASSQNLSAQRSALVELAKLSLDISFRKIIFDGDGLTTALYIVEGVKDLHVLVASSPTETNAPLTTVSLGLQVLEKALEVVTNVCEDAPALASLLQHQGADRLVKLISRLVDVSPDIVHSKVVISIAYNMVRILLQMLMFHKPPATEHLVPALPFLLRLISVDISQASYQSLQLTKIVCDTLVKLMDDAVVVRYLLGLKATQLFLNLLVRYRPSLQSPNIADVAITAISRLLGQSEVPLASLGLYVGPQDLESLFSYHKFPIVLQVVFGLASDRHSSFRGSLDKSAIEKLVPHLHSLLSAKPSSKSASIDPITFVTALFQTKSPSQPPSFTVLDDQSLIALVHALIGYLDPKAHRMVADSDLHLGSGKILLNGLSLLSHMAKRTCVQRPKIPGIPQTPSSLNASSSNILVSTSDLESSLGSLKASSLLKADSQEFRSSDPPRLALLQLIFTLTSIYFPEVPLDISEVSPTTTTNSQEPQKPSTSAQLLDIFGDISSTSTPLSTATNGGASTSSTSSESVPAGITLSNQVASSGPSAVSPSATTSPQKFNYAPIELMQLTELLLSLLASLGKSSSIHRILFQSGILALISNTLNSYLQIETDVASNSSDLSLAARQDIVVRQMPHVLSLIEAIATSPPAAAWAASNRLTSTLFEILAIGAPISFMTGILDILRVFTNQEESVRQVLESDGLMSLIGLLSNDNNHIASLSLSILCNLAKFDEVQAQLATYIDSSLLSELDARLVDSELAFHLSRLKSYLGLAE